jgi:hypothetical protein
LYSFGTVIPKKSPAKMDLIDSKKNKKKNENKKRKKTRVPKLGTYFENRGNFRALNPKMVE